jgi:hypothetical protein
MLTERQQYLLNTLYNTYMELYTEAEGQEDFSEFLATHSRLFPMSIDELAQEFYNLAHGE